MPTPEEQLTAKKEELQRAVDEYNAGQQAQQEKGQKLVKLQGAIEALSEVVSSTEEG